jgi:hypothetical protein
MDIATEPVPDTRHKELTPAKEPTPQPTVDIEMTESEDAIPKLLEPKQEEAAEVSAPEPPKEAPKEVPQPSAQPPDPPWSASTLAEPSPKSTTGLAPKPADLHGEMPTKHDSVNTSNNRAVTPGSTSSIFNESTVAQSPGTSIIASPFSPAVNNALKPAPARKKLSLSDYTNRNRKTKLAQTQSTGSNATPPLNSQSTSSPTLSTASLPNTNSPPPKAVEAILPPVVEETKPSEVPVAPTMATTSTST